MIRKLMALLLVLSFTLATFLPALAGDETINRHVFTGKEYDENTGLIYFGARYYDPDTGRFITQDSYQGTITNPPSLNRYLYAYSNPMCYVDPSGHYVESAWDLFSLGVGAGSLLYNVKRGSWGDAALDAVGVVADTAALALPVVPGGAGVAIKAGRLAKAGAKAVEAVNATKAIKYASKAVERSRTLERGISAARAADSAINTAQGIEAGIGAAEDIREGQYTRGLMKAGAASLQAGHIAARAISGTRNGITMEDPSGRGSFAVTEDSFDVAAVKLTESGRVTSKGLPTPIEGDKVYRVYGGDSTASGASWTPINPADVPNYRDVAGLPSGGPSGYNNTGRFVIEGTLIDPAKVVKTRQALPLDSNVGGLIEYIVPKWLENGAIRVDRVSGVNPEF